MRTWDDNKTAIHELWPQHEFTGEEAKLWREDLIGLDQDTLYDSLRNVKRNQDTIWVHLKWIKEEYNALKKAKHRTGGKIDRGEKLNLKIDPDENKRLAEQFRALIEVSSPPDFQSIEKKVLDKLPNMDSPTAFGVLIYARARLLGQLPRFGRVTPDGDVEPFHKVPCEIESVWRGDAQQNMTDGEYAVWKATNRPGVA